MAVLPALASGALLAAWIAHANSPSGSGFQVDGHNLRANVNAGTFALDDIELSQTGGTRITARKANATGPDFDNARYDLNGEVHIEYQDVVLDASTAVVVLANGRLMSVKVQGDTHFTHQLREAGKRNNGTATAIEYDTTSGNVRFLPPASFMIGRNEYSSEKPLVYNTDSTELRSEQSDNGDARIRGIINPETPGRVPPPRTPGREQSK